MEASTHVIGILITIREIKQLCSSDGFSIDKN